MSSAAELAVAYAFCNAPVQAFPYPHVYVRDIFPRDFYARLLSQLPPSEALKPLLEARSVKGYPERFVLGLTEAEIATLPEQYRAFWRELARWMTGGRFMRLVLDKFGPYISQRFAGQASLELTDEALLIEDRTNYSLGPHTDAVTKVVSMLFYLPVDESQAHLGTSIYVPRDPSFTCPGGPHHAFDRFEHMAAMPFLPNTMFAFVKTDNAFHGVEPVRDADARRHLLLYDIRLAKVPEPVAPGTGGSTGVPSSGARFTF